MLGSARNSTKTASSRSVSLVKVGFANASAFEFLLHGMTSIKAAENELSCYFAFYK